MRREEFQKLLKRYKKGLCTPEEQALIETWFKAMESSEDTSLAASEKAEMKKRSWTRVQDHILRAKNKGTDHFVRQKSVRLQRGPFWAIAATLLLVSVSLVFVIVSPRSGETETAYTPVEKNISNNTERIMEVLLSDGSLVSLEPRSSILFKEPFDKEDQRLVTLEGEAFFSVARDAARPFLVNTNQVITKVLGTTFSVSAFPDEEHITVSVMTGKVSVMTRKDNKADDGPLDETILTPNQKVIYNKNKNLLSRAIVKEPAPIIPAEEVERLHFEAAPIKEVFEGLEQVYGVDIAFDQRVFSSCILTTSIGGGSIFNRLDMICKAIDAQYTVKENIIVITGAGCKP